jgi:hypothetical protein
VIRRAGADAKLAASGARRLKNRAFIGGKGERRWKEGQELSDFTDDSNDPLLWTCLGVSPERDRLWRRRETA